MRMKKVMKGILPTLVLTLGMTWAGQSSAAYALIDLNVGGEVSAVAEEPETVKVVEVRYEDEGKFLALLPMSLTVVARAYPDGKVEVEYPWYSFLTIDNREKIETELQIVVDTTMRWRMVGSVQAQGKEANPSFSAEEAREMRIEMNTVLAHVGQVGVQ